MATINLKMPELDKSIKLLFDLMKFGRISLDGNTISLKRNSKIELFYKDEITITFSNEIQVKNKDFKVGTKKIEILNDLTTDLKKLFTEKYFSVSKIGFKVSNVNPIFLLEYLDNYISLKCTNDVLELVYTNYIDLNIKEIKIYRDYALIIKQGLDFKIVYN